MAILRERDPDVVYSSSEDRNTTALSIGLGVLLLAVIGLLIFFAINARNQPQVIDEASPPSASSPTVIPMPQPYAVPVPQTVTQPVPVPIVQPIPATAGAGSTTGSTSGGARANRTTGTPSSSTTSSGSDSLPGGSESTPSNDHSVNSTSDNPSTSNDTNPAPVTP